VRHGVTGLMGYVRSWPAPIGASVGSEPYGGFAAALRFLSALALFATACLPLPVSAQGVPAPSQVAPPVIAPPPAAGRISIPQVPAGAQIPAEAKRLSFKLLGFDIKGEFEELVEKRKEIEAPLIGRTITVAQIFDFADHLQQIYAKAGYPLVRVVLLPQELNGAARIKLNIIDGFVERLDVDALPLAVQGRVATTLAPLLNKTHLTQAELERRLLIAGETPGLTLNATFAPGKETGGSVLVLTGRYRPVSLSAYVDNAMPQVFGTGQGVLSASLNSALGLGEQVTVQAAGLPSHDYVAEMPTRRYLSGILSIPLGIDGWRFEAGGVDGVTTPHGDPAVATKGVYNEGYVKIAYEALKRRDYELTVNTRLDAANQKIETLLVDPAVLLSSDRLRVSRTGIDGIWRLRESGTTVIYGGNYSRGLDILGARTAAEAPSWMPLSRQGADAVFDKLDAHIEIDQALTHDFFVNFYASGQDSFRRALLTSEQFNIDGSRMLSGFTAGALPGDSAWVVRGELGRTFTAQLPFYGGFVWMLYLFGAHGERLLWDPTVLELGDVHATNYGVGMRFNLLPSSDHLASAYGFVEASHRSTNLPGSSGDRIFAGMLLQY
jgi:hemolysin activation/secretion protein